MGGKFLLCLVLLCVISNYSDCKTRGPKKTSGRLPSRPARKPSINSGSKYPSSTGLSGSNIKKHNNFTSNTHHSVYRSGNGLSGNTPSRPVSGVSHTTNVHNHYHTHKPTNSGPAVSYPVSGSKSPSSTGLSGSNIKKHNNYTSNTQNSVYPSGNGLSGNTPSRPASGVSHTTNVHNHYHTHTPAPPAVSYPDSESKSASSTGLSGSNIKIHNNYTSNTQNSVYPSGNGLSGNTPSRPASGVSHTTNVHNHYQTHTPAPPAVSYPDSGSKFASDTLVAAGHALLNLTKLGFATYASAPSGSGQTTYVNKPSEECLFSLKKDNGDYEETKRIDCNVISSFIYEEKAKHQTSGTNATVVTTTTVTNVTTLNANGSVYSPPQIAKTLYEKLPNGTLVPVKATNINTTATNSPTSPGTVHSSTIVTITTKNTTTTNALDVNGKPVDVTPGMQCHVIRKSKASNMTRSVPCDLLQTYATHKKNTKLNSLKKNSASRNLPVLCILSVVIAVFVAY